MRITQRSMQAGVETGLQSALSRVQRLQQQLASGKAVGRPSDSPTSAVAALRYRADIRRGEQLKRNADDAQGWLDTTDRALTAQSGVILRARELLLQGVNASMSTQDRTAVAEEIDRLRELAITIANTTYLGRPVFAGTSPQQQAFDPVTGAYLGDSGVVDRAVAANAAVRVNVTGPDAFGAAGADLFTLLASIADHLRTDVSQLQGDLAALDSAGLRVTNQLAGVGARANQVDQLRDRLESRLLDSANGLAEVESIDLPATIIQLQLQEVAYQAALAATARVIQPSLVDFLR